jgi:hypothetical protein
MQMENIEINYDGVDDLEIESTMGSRPTISSISMFSAPHTFESIITPNNLVLEAKVPWMGIVEDHFDLESKGMDPSPQIIYALSFFVVNDGRKPNFISVQAMHCVICHSFFQMYNFGNTNKKQNGVITYN